LRQLQAKSTLSHLLLIFWLLCAGLLGQAVGVGSELQAAPAQIAKEDEEKYGGKMPDWSSHAGFVHFCLVIEKLFVFDRL
jgi:hypothetical protein